MSDETKISPSIFSVRGIWKEIFVFRREENMAVSKFDDLLLTGRQKRAIRHFTKLWERAAISGDADGMALAHEAAEGIRATEGYSGGPDGTAYKRLA